jgi:hypothetical protein
MKQISLLYNSFFRIIFRKKKYFFFLNDKFSFFFKAYGTYREQIDDHLFTFKLQDDFERKLSAKNENNIHIYS